MNELKGDISKLPGQWGEKKSCVEPDIKGSCSCIFTGPAYFHTKLVANVLYPWVIVTDHEDPDIKDIFLDKVPEKKTITERRPRKINPGYAQEDIENEDKLLGA